MTQSLSYHHVMLRYRIVNALHLSCYLRLIIGLINANGMHKRLDMLCERTRGGIL